ncbi:oligosaccharide flippase family protein [Pokkaliibacter sp. CJK22405]|uniref:oligosaccharide flippase family protein n=1 Tax=Pokkaliibacter sp. CJK22405 TaxID=3384615 RepID=UPI0039852BDF
MKFKGYRRHLLLSLGTRIAMTVLRLLRNVLLARILGPGERGLFALLSALPELIAAITSGGLNTALGFEAAQHRRMGILLVQALFFGCLLATGATLLGVSGMVNFGQALDVTQELGQLIWLLLIAVPLVVLKASLLTLHNASGHVSQYNLMRLLESLIPLLAFLCLFMLWGDHALLAAISSWLIGLTTSAVIGWCWMKRLQPFALEWDKPANQELLSYSKKSHPGVLFQQLMARADYVLIGLLIGSEQLGYYAMASAAAELLSIVPEAVTTPLMKRLLRQESDMQAITPFALRMTALTMLLACAAMALVGDWLIVTLFGDAYEPAYSALLILLPGMLFNCYSSILRLDLLGKGKPGGLSIRAGMGAAASVILNLILIPTFGIEGAALANSLASLLVCTLLLRWYCQLSGTPLHHTLWPRRSDWATLKHLTGSSDNPSDKHSEPTT